MNRREVLIAFRNFCILNGLSGVLIPQSFGQSAPNKTRFVNFVIKYTGGATYNNGLGHWNFDSVLAPLAPYRNEMCIPLGLNCEFKIPMNSHAAPQISALSGSLSGYEYKEGTAYPIGNLANYSTGGGKSIDVLIGEKLKSIYNCQLPTIQISSYVDPTLALQASTWAQSSYGTGGALAPTYSVVNELSAELKNRIQCTAPTNSQTLKATVERKLAALEAVKRNSQIFNSKYFIDKDKFENIEAKTKEAMNNLSGSLNSASGVPSICSQFPTLPRLPKEYVDENSINRKMNAMFDLGVAALQSNVTRVLTINLQGSTHNVSHYIQDPPVDQYLHRSRFLQQQVANFIAKLKAAGMYDETLIFCNAGSCMTNECHNYENMSTYVINGGKVGPIGSPSAIKPIGSLLADILGKFDVRVAEYGGRNHRYGVGKPGSFI
ncbi:MAG: hypothetical protein A4S09_09825 [Proteobacteria bacterium SG_bin7]|nr:MAG: hypothetical protein A4S09_09825 [Proteobacteria bacterium SG_bin7]